jgi:hypothetical protein
MTDGPLFAGDRYRAPLYLRARVTRWLWIRGANELPARP